MTKKLNRYKAVLFDWDGTLQDSLEIWLTSIKAAFKNHHITISDEKIAKEILSDLSGNVGRYGITNIPEFKKELGEMPNVKDVYKHSTLHRNAEKLLKTLKERGIKLAVITNTYEWLVAHSLKHHNVYDYFDVIVTRDMVSKRKPHPDPILKALELLGLQHTDVVMVGDSPVDVEAGKNSRVKTILHYPKNHSQYFDETFVKSVGADHIVTQLMEIARLI